MWGATHLSYLTDLKYSGYYVPPRTTLICGFQNRLFVCLIFLFVLIWFPVIFLPIFAVLAGLLIFLIYS